MGFGSYKPVFNYVKLINLEVLSSSHYAIECSMKKLEAYRITDLQFSY